MVMSDGWKTPGSELSLLHGKSAEEQLLEKTRRILEAARSRMLLPQHVSNQDVVVGIVLRRRPNRKDQVIRIAFGNLAGLGPGADHLRLLVDEALQGTLELILDMRRALQHLVGEQAAFARKI